MMNMINLIIAMAPTQPGADAAQAPTWVSIVPWILIFVLMYFVLIRPQAQRQKQQEALVKSAKTGDKVIVAGGIHGTITNVKDTTVTVKIDEGVKIEVEKSSIVTIVKE